jgi:hypothetical protein
MDALLASYAAPVKDTLIKAFTAIAVMRGEDPTKVVLEGMDDFSAEEPDVSSSDEESEDTPASSKTGSSKMEDALNG